MRLYDIIVPEYEVPGGSNLSAEAENKCIILVTEFMELDLRSTLSNSHKMKSFDEEMVTMIIYNLLSSLNFLHKSNIMHRDIKPGNILMDYNCVVKLCDFGLARTTLKRSHEFSKLLRTELKSLA